MILCPCNDIRGQELSQFVSNVSQNYNLTEKWCMISTARLLFVLDLLGPPKRDQKGYTVG